VSQIQLVLIPVLLVTEHVQHRLVSVVTIYRLTLGVSSVMADHNEGMIAV
jgi:hypothetical protein